MSIKIKTSILKAKEDHLDYLEEQLIGRLSLITERYPGYSFTIIKGVDEIIIKSINLNECAN